MSIFADAPNPFREAVGPTEHSMLLRPVSRVSFTLTDTSAFEKATHFAVEWLTDKTGGVLPPEALDLKSFDTRGIEGYHPCHAVRLDDSQGRIWASRVDEPGSRPEAGETWSTELFVEHRESHLVRFGAQLSARRQAGGDPLRSSRPRLVYDLLRALSAEADGESISENVSSATSGDMANVVDLIYRPNRRLPIVAISTDDAGGAQFDLRRLAVRLSGAAHLVALDPTASWELTHLLGKRMSTFNRAVRIYMPGVVEEEEDPYQHPLWLDPHSGHNHGLLDTLAERIFPLGFRDGDGGSRFWHSAQLRQAASTVEAKRARGSETDQLQSEIVALNDQINEINETLEIAKALEKIASENESSARYEVEQLKAENDILRRKIYRLQNSSDNQYQESKTQDERSLRDYDDLEDWAEEVLGANITIHRRALKDCRQNGHSDMLKRIESTLLAIRDFWIPYKIFGGFDRREAMLSALGSLGVDDEACFARRDKAKDRPEYSVHDGEFTRVLYDHFKHGNSRSNSEQFRIYYSWDEDKENILIGKMPSHLQNDMS